MWKFALTLVALVITIESTRANYCPKNEIYDGCPSPCPPRTCATKDIQVKCIKPLEVGDPKCPKAACRCEDGFYRNEEGKCVTYEECGTVCPLNEEFDWCPNPCPPRNCNTSDILFNCLAGPTYPDPACPTPVCRCSDGFYRNDQGFCVTKEECPKKCPKNEVLDFCPASCPPRTCATKDALFKCAAPLEVGDPNCAAPACRCEDGFYRNDDGDCVTYEECGHNCGTNEVWDSCAPSSPPQTCDYLNGYEKACKHGKCTAECRCQEGYYRNYLGNCIPKERCLECSGPNEFWSCGGACDNVCETLSKQNQTSCPIINIKCNEMCYCKDGFARNAKGICVPFAKCETNCPKNEIYDDCPSPCPPRTCAKKDIQVKCIKPLEVGDPKCPKAACRCEDGFYRNEEGKCVTYKKCAKKAVSYKHTRTTRAIAVQCSSEDVQAGVTNFDKGNDEFSADFYSELSKEQPSASTISSPYSLLFLLAQLALYTTGVSYDQLIAALGLQSKEQVRCTFPSLLDAIASQTDVTFDLVTKVYSNVGNTLSESYKTDSRDVFRSEAETLDFSQSAQAAQTINTWVAENTNNKITGLISADALSALTRLVLVNALYFNGKWQKSFNVNATRDLPFYVSSTETKTVPTMTQKSHFFYTASDELDCQILSMPYTGGKFSFVIFLPNQQDGLAALQEKMKDVSVVESAINSATNVSITVYIPKFTITTTIDLTQLLSQIGITQIFNKSDSGISGLLENPEDVYVSDAIQKAFIDVSEEGTEAAAANAIIITARATTRAFRANRPFVYQLVYENSPVFVGNYLGPV